MKNNLFLLIIMFLISCSVSNKDDAHKDENILLIDIENQIKESNIAADTFTLNNIASNVNIIPLETSDKSFLYAHNLRVHYINNKYIISSGIFSKCNVIMFDTLGKFIEDLTCKGNGHNEVPRVAGVFGNNHRNQLCIQGEVRIIVNKFSENKRYNFKYDNYFINFALLNNGDYICCPLFGFNDKIPYMYFVDSIGVIKDSLIYNNKRDLNIIPNNTLPGIIYDSYKLYPNYDGDVLFKDLFNDTIYKIKDEKVINPYIVFRRGKYTPTDKDFNNLNDNSSKVFIRDICESENFILFRYVHDKFSYIYMWDKKNNKELSRTKIDRNSVEANFYRFPCKYLFPNGKVELVDIVGMDKNKIYIMLKNKQPSYFLKNIDMYSNPIIMVINF